MKIMVATAALLLGAAGLASAQDDRKPDEFRREFEKAMKGLQQKFDAERERLEKEFRAARERLLEKKGERRDEDQKPRSTEDLLKRVMERLDQLEKRLDREMPLFQFKQFERPLEKFRDFREFAPGFRDFKEFAPRFKDLLPKFKDEDFRFEFRKKEKKDRKDDY